MAKFDGETLQDNCDFPPRYQITGNQGHDNDSLRDQVKICLQDYFLKLKQMKLEENDLFDLVLSEVEETLLRTTLTYVKWNQSRASLLLGMNRVTLRKKMKRYGML